MVRVGFPTRKVTGTVRVPIFNTVVHSDMVWKIGRLNNRLIFSARSFYAVEPSMTHEVEQNN